MRNVAILLFDQIEVLDFAGPYEVFNVTAELNPPTPASTTTTTAGGGGVTTGGGPLFNVYTVAESSSPIRTRGQLSVNPNYNLYSMPQPNIIVIPGGSGCRALLQKPHVLDWLRNQHSCGDVEYILSVCTGSLILAKAGLLQHLNEVTSHHDNLQELQQLLDESNNTYTKVNDTKRYIIDPNPDQGCKILTSGGISAGIDMCLYMVHKLHGTDVVVKTLNEMEYPWKLDDTTLPWKETSQALLDEEKKK